MGDLLGALGDVWAKADQTQRLAVITLAFGASVAAMNLVSSLVQILGDNKKLKILNEQLVWFQDFVDKRL